MKRLTLALLLLCLCVCGDAWGATYYVQQTAAGDGSGSSIDNAAAIATFNANTAPFNSMGGHTIYFLDTITTSPVMPSSGSAGNIAIIRGDYPGHPGIVNGVRFLASAKNYFSLINLTFTGSTNTAAIVFYTVTNVIVTGCTLTNSGIAVHGIYCHNSSIMTISNNNISGFNSNYQGGLYFAYNTARSHDITISGNTISNCYYGIYLNSVTVVALSGNITTGKTGSKVGAGIEITYTAGVTTDLITIGINSATGFSRGIQIQGSLTSSDLITNVTITGGTYDSNSDSGIEITGKASNITITGPGTTNSNGTGTHGTGIEIYSSSSTYYPTAISVINWTSNSNTDNGLGDGVGFRADNNAENCVFIRVSAYNNQGPGLIFNSNKGGNIVKYSVFSGNNTLANTDWGNILFSGSASNSSALNCILYQGTNGVVEGLGAGTGNIVRNCIVSGATWRGFKGSSSDMTAQYNIVYNCGTAYDSVTEGTGSIQSDPLFLSSTDFRLQSSSPARGAGTDVWTGTANVTDYRGRAITNGAGVLVGNIDIGSHRGQTRPFNTNNIFNFNINKYQP